MEEIEQQINIKFITNFHSSHKKPDICKEFFCMNYCDFCSINTSFLFTLKNEGWCGCEENTNNPGRHNPHQIK